MDFFRLMNKGSFMSSMYSRKYYTWHDYQYRDFMVQILTSLEPFREKKNIHLIQELEECNIISFVLKGTILIGFDVNHQLKYCIKQQDKSVIGAYESTFDQRAALTYTTKTPINGFFIRKPKWREAIEENENVGITMRKNIWVEFNTRLKTKITLAKKRWLSIISKRQDMELLAFSIDKQAFKEDLGKSRMMKDIKKS